MQSQNKGLIVPNRSAQYQPPNPNIIISYMTDPRTRVPNPLYPIRIIRSDMNEPIIHAPTEHTYQSSPQVKFWLEKPAPTLRQLIKNWLNKK